MFSEKRLYLKLDYNIYRSAITSDRLIQLSALTVDKETMDYRKAEKTIVLDEPDIHIKVRIKMTFTTSEQIILFYCKKNTEIEICLDGEYIEKLVIIPMRTDKNKKIIVFYSTDIFYSFGTLPLNSFPACLKFIILKQNRYKR